MYKENTNDIVKEKAEKINEDITKTVKLMRERPYMSSEKKREKIIKAEPSVVKYIRNHFFEGKVFLIIENKVVVNCGCDSFFITPAGDWI